MLIERLRPKKVSIGVQEAAPSTTTTTTSTTTTAFQGKNHLKNITTSTKPTEYDSIHPLKWLDLNGRFNVTVYSSNITNAETTTHRQTLVTGTAKDLIRGYGHNGDFYKNAIENLRSNFGMQIKVVSENLFQLQRF